MVTHVQQLAHMGQRSEVFKNVAANATARAQWAEAHLEHSKLEQILPHRQECQELKLEHDAGKSQVKNVLQQHVAALKDMKGVVESAQRETLLSRNLCPRCEETWHRPQLRGHAARRKKNMNAAPRVYGSMMRMRYIHTPSQAAHRACDSKRVCPRALVLAGKRCCKEV